MIMFLSAARLALPTLFFGYAIFANLTLFSQTQSVLQMPDTGLLAGGLTHDLDSLYKKDLPHMSLSFGVIGAARYALLREARPGAVVGQDGWLFSTEEVRPMPSDASLSGIIAHMQDIHAQLASSGITLVVVPLPAKIDVYRDLSPDPAFGEMLEQLYSTFTADLMADGVAVVDARRALLNPVKPVFFASDTHWTPLGTHLVATAVDVSGMIAAGSTRFVLTQKAPKTLSGDLVSFVTTESFAPAIGLSRETVAPVELTAFGDDSDLFGTADTDIVLVGTSYSANSDWGFANALMQVLRRDVVNVAQEGLGPLKPMQAYLESADFREAPPKVVIWEFPIRYLTDPETWALTAPPAPKMAARSPKDNTDG